LNVKLTAGVGRLYACASGGGHHNEALSTLRAADASCQSGTSPAGIRRRMCLALRDPETSVELCELVGEARMRQAGVFLAVQRINRDHHA